MLNQETKRKIDNARDILVWKIPVPMSQIEQITLAMTYKFMSDIDEENKELGWASFFEWNYEKYAWKNLMDKRLWAQERMNLYSEWLESMSKNKNIPELFRDIFRWAYLPFKDPQILDRFLKQINEFSYDHSEELWNAFEYLLSTAWSQWDAGQFRTPRHIIDFLVSVVEPTKDDLILDPACGTAWFLISAYKFILNQNTNKAWKIDNKIELTKKLSKNITGYDISHDMVRLSLVNMYLHNFANPKIYEYDTLSSEDRWNDDFDCILANPPFMTPKWWIQPHSKFSIRASKSEVLFVDYIMEHLTINWKAGIIVPEWIIFQSANAYKDLRKKMIEQNYLWAVVSLPSGIFQPYSWVKTSILLFDKQIAKKTDKILFVKVENDWYDLGAQRREINKNDLPKSLELILNYKKNILNSGYHSEQSEESKNVLIIEKSKIREIWDYNLSFDRFRINNDFSNIQYSMVKIWDLFDSWRWRVINKKDIENNKWVYPVYSSQTTNDWVFWYINTYDFEWEYITWTTDWANAWTVFYRNWKFNCTNVCGTLKIKNEFEWKVSLNYVARVLNNEAYKYVVQVWNPKLMNKDMEEIKIPLPPLEIQEQIVEELDNYQKIIDWAKQIVENYKPRIKIDPSWEVVELGEVCENFQYWTSTKSSDVWDIVCLRMWNLQNWTIDWSDLKYSWEEKEIEKYLLNYNDVLFNRTNSPDLVWKTSIYKWEKKAIFAWYLIRINYLKDKLNWDYLNIILNSKDAKEYCMKVKTDWINQSNINAKLLSQFKIPLPPLEVQEQIVSKIEEEQKMVESAKWLIETFENKIKERIGEIWGEKSN